MSATLASRYVAELETEAGALPFILHVEDGVVSIENGPERIEIAGGTITRDRMKLDFPHYASTITATWDRSLEEYVGTWTKRRDEGERAIVPFRARPSTAPRFATESREAEKFVGRWRVEFAGDDDPALAEFSQVGDEIVGTIITTTGDYRYLAGGATRSTLRLSCFDGAHAFLFVLELGADDRLDGVFWSGNWWHTRLAAERDATFTLPDPFALTEWNAAVRLEDLSFPGLDGIERNLASPEVAGKARIIQVFGSWCPNCHDASNYLRELHERFGEEGLSIVGLAFEITGDFETDRLQVERSIERHETPYPILIAGTADKVRATEQLRALTFVKSYPTTIFLTGAGEVRAIYTGFSGPATGRAHEELKRSFERLTRELLE